MQRTAKFSLVSMAKVGEKINSCFREYKYVGDTYICVAVAKVRTDLEVMRQGYLGLKLSGPCSEGVLNTLIDVSRFFYLKKRRRLDRIMRLRTTLVIIVYHL